MTSSQQTLEKLLNDTIDNKKVDIAELRNCLLSVSGDQRFHSLTNVVCGLSKDTALHRAAEKGYTDIIKCLLDGLPEDQLFDLLKIQNELGDTSLHRASLHGHTHIIKHIMDLLKPEQKTELLDICNNSDETALNIARRESKEDAAVYLEDCRREATKMEKKRFEGLEARMKIKELQLEEKICQSLQELEMVVYLQNLQLEENKRKIQELKQSQDLASSIDNDADVGVDESVNGKILGKGAYGTVYGQFDTQTKRMVAIKKVDLGSIRSGEITKEVEILCRELSVMKDFSHKRIVKYIRAETDSNTLCLYMENMAGRSVKDQLDTHGPFSELLTQMYTRQILDGLSYLHGKHIIHRDIKGQNILCDGKGNIKLTNFGISKELLNIQTLTGHTNMNTNNVGTAHFMAPEIINGTDYGEKADVWSTGATIVEMLTAHPPWYKFEALLALYRIGKGDYPVYILNPETSANAKSFLDLTFKSKEERPTADELLQNRWLVNLPAENELLGKGAYGRVHLQFDSQTNRMLAVKKIDMGPDSRGSVSKEVKVLYRELALMKDFNHKRIVQFIRAETESNTLCIYMEYMAGRSVEDQLVIHGPFSEFLTQTYTRQILEGLSYLHRKGIMHRDVKGRNILCDGKGNIKLNGFGTSKKLLNIQTLTGHTNANTDNVGTSNFMAPEIINSTDYGENADIWSAGATVVQMLTGHPPWHKFTHFQVIFLCGKGDYPVYVLNLKTSRDVKNFLELTFKPKEERPTADELLQNHWLLNLPAENDHLPQNPTTSADACAKDDDFVEGKLLGKGAFGSVYLQTDSKTNKRVAVKKVDLGAIVGNEVTKEVKALRAEISLMKQLSHERIVCYIRMEEQPNFLCIYMEYMNAGSVKNQLDINGSFDEVTTKKYTRQTLEGLSYLHREHIIHRDIKGSNILCDLSGNIKLADFGVSKRMRTIQTMTDAANQNNTCIGTAYWMTPEVINDEVYGRKVDIWSTGATVVEMMTTRPPWRQLTPVQAIFKIGTLRKAHYVLDPTISGDAENFLALTFKPEKERPTAEELLLHLWLNNS